MSINTLIWILFFSFIAPYSSEKSNLSVNTHSPIIYELNDELTKIISYDKFNPPQSSRVYVYPNIAAYEIIALTDKKFCSLGSQLNDLPKLSKRVIKSLRPKTIDPEIALFTAFAETVDPLIYSIEIWKENVESIRQRITKGKETALINRSEKAGKVVAKHVLDWANKDTYRQRSTLPRHELKKTDGNWSLTPPDYKDAMEPNWAQLRPYVIDHPKTFLPPAPTPFSTDKRSDFYKNTIEVYNILEIEPEKRKKIAWFWDDNAAATIHQGHFMSFVFKQTPAGHWMNIAKYISQNHHESLSSSTETMMLTSVAMADAFISVWYAKYHYDYIRPITFINQYINPNWDSVLQNPNFPEYPSGHSGASAAAGTVLIHKFGDKVTFLDKSIINYGLAPKTFHSISEAYQEASISRVYGGIHFVQAIEEGTKQGEKIGRYLINTVRTTKH